MIEKNVRNLDFTGLKGKVDVPNQLDDMLDGDRVAANEQNISLLQGQVASQHDEITALNTGKQNNLTAGDNISITNNVISANLQFYCLTITLNSAEWYHGVQVKNIAEITADSIIWVSPVPTNSNISNYAAAGIYASAQGNGTLEFVASGVVQDDIDVNIIINNAANNNIQQGDNLYINQINEQVVQNGNTLIIGGNSNDT